MEVDFFVSHAWAHPFHRTVESLTNFANDKYKCIRRASDDEVVFWICLFALKQHKATEEVGETPENGPFNAVLAKARHGGTMVLDAEAQLMERIWCLYEVKRAKEFKQPL